MTQPSWNSDDRTVATVLQNGVHDGGQWDMFVNIVKKYGVVPKYVMPETFQSSNTNMMNSLLNTSLKAAAVKLRKWYREGKDTAFLAGGKGKSSGPNFQLPLHLLRKSSGEL